MVLNTCSDLRSDDTSTSQAARARPLRVIIIGGGLAGMAAGVALEEGGAHVTLLEARRTLGGRAGSFEDPQTGEVLDNCQHVLLGCCTNLLDFYGRIGASDLIRIERTVHFADGVGHIFDLSGTGGLPAPLHLSASLLKFDLLTWAERVHLSRAMLAMLSIGRAGRDRLADVPFGDWLDQHHQPASLVKKLYEPLLVGALNEEVRLASAEYAIQVFQEALLTNAGGYVIGVPNCPLGQLYAKLPCRDVRMGTRVKRVLFDARRAIGVQLVDGLELRADAIILATPWQSAGRFIPDDLRESDARFRDLDRLDPVPILGVHLWFDRPVLDRPHVALVEGPLQWLFRKDARGRQLHGVISAARAWVNRPKEECLALFEAQVRATFSAARSAKLIRGVVVVEKRATFAPVPGIDRLRPSQAPPAGGLEGLYLAGDYTQTHWPATMEGAVRSGYLAADAVLQLTGSGGRKHGLQNDLPIQWPARLLGVGA